MKNTSGDMSKEVGSSAKAPPADLKDFASLLEVMKTLLEPDGCPWDKDQTHQSLIPYLVEESYEVIEAIERDDKKNLTEELGDLLLQIVFHAELARRENYFDISDVIFSINEKMIRRHPHVFSNTVAHTADEVKKNWEEIKRKEKAGKVSEDSWGGPLGLPSLQRSFKIGEKTRKHAFDWPNADGVWKKLDEELKELKESVASGSTEAMDHELGDVLFTVAQLSRHLGIDPESSLRKANRRFETRYRQMRELAEKQGLSWEKLSEREKEDLWSAAKALEARK